MLSSEKAEIGKLPYGFPDDHMQDGNFAIVLALGTGQ